MELGRAGETGHETLIYYRPEIRRGPVPHAETQMPPSYNEPAAGSTRKKSREAGEPPFCRRRKRENKWKTKTGAEFRVIYDAFNGRGCFAALEDRETDRICVF